MDDEASSSSSSVAKQAFAMLQPFCSRLMELPLNKTEAEPLLKSLRNAIGEAPLEGLRHCFEYVLFPLQLLLDASVVCRSKKSLIDTSQAELLAGATTSRLYVSDKIAEGVLVCLVELLIRCPITSISQMNVLLRKLTTAAILSGDEASEEFRHGAVRSLRSLLMGLKPCQRCSCSCKDVSLPQYISAHEGGLKVELENAAGKPLEEMHGEITDECDECMISFLRSENMSPAIGHLLSLFLQISEAEASKGGTGNAKLRVDALLALRVLILKVGTADALAYFLPGVTSRLVKSLQSSKRMNVGLSELSYPIGAAGSSKAIEEAVRALVEFLVLVLSDERNTFENLGRAESTITSTDSPEPWSAEKALTRLRTLSNDVKGTKESKNENLQEMHNSQAVSKSEDTLSPFHISEQHTNERVEKFRVERNKRWLDFTLEKIKNLLSLSFPALCRHKSPSVRVAIAESIMMLMLTCRHTLEGFISTFLECLLALACDEWPYVASTTHKYLIFLLRNQGGNFFVLDNIVEDLKLVIRRLIGRIPKTIFSADESATVFLCRQLLAAMFFAGPEGVSDSIFHSPTITSQFISAMCQCFSFNTKFMVSLRQLSLVDRSSPGYVPGILELSSNAITEVHEKNISTVNTRDFFQSVKADVSCQQLPRMPPWFNETVGHKVYHELAGILRLSGLSCILGGEKHIHDLIEELLAPFRRFSLDLQSEQFVDEVYHGAGEWQRTAATAVCVLNEIFYGASGLWCHDVSSLFRGLCSSKNIYCLEVSDSAADGIGLSSWSSKHESIPKILSEYIGEIIHEFVSEGIWKLPLSMGSYISLPSTQLHILRDNAFLQQIVLESIGVLALAAGKMFEEQGFLGSILYLLLERLGCAEFSVSSTADLALHVVSSACDYTSVRDLVVASRDYIVDSLCRQLRHTDLYPGAPNMLVAVLRYTGAGQDLVSLLKEPMHSISLELEIPAREHSSWNTLPMLRALTEIVKTANTEGCSMLERATLRSKNESCADEKTYNGKQCQITTDDYEVILSNLKDEERCRQSIQDILLLCLTSAAPLLASKDERKCLLALEIIEVGIAALACMDEVSKHEKEIKESVKKMIGKDYDDGVEDVNEAEPPKLLPTMNRVWPHLASSLKHRTPSVLIKSLQVIASVVYSCGGEFFTRRFVKDAVPRFLNLLCEGTLSRNKSSNTPNSGRMLPYVQDKVPEVHKEFASASSLRVQEAVFNCISAIAKSRKSAPALACSVQQLAAVSVGFACAWPALKDSATEALISLSNIDADLVWILVAEVAYCSYFRPEDTSNLPKISKLLPPSISQQDALWNQLSGKELGFEIDSSKAGILLSRLESNEYERTQTHLS